ncbi:hypothetical protein [Ekhidna sp.]|uniref:hypothetical protein n=1 Tax=Ekhidna sp. TaxID=2608089 RepID=UPI00329750ED
MRNLFLIRFLALVLCSAMVCEVASIVEGADVISAEADSEMEHEESKEKEKEKTTSAHESILLAENSIINQSSLAVHRDRSWNNPFIDFQTPPPKLS